MLKADDVGVFILRDVGNQARQVGCNTKNARPQLESASPSGADVTHDAGELLRTLRSISSTVRLRPDVDTVAVFDQRE